MSKLLILLLGGVIIFNLNGGIENEQTIPEKEGKRIAGRIRCYTNFDRKLQLENKQTFSRNSRTITRITQEKSIGVSRGRERLQVRSSQSLRASSQLIYHYADKYKISRQRFYNLIQKESGLRVYARSPNGTYIGLAQWRPDYYNRQAKAWGFTPNIYNGRQHLEVTAKAIACGQSWRWPSW